MTLLDKPMKNMGEPGNNTGVAPARNTGGENFANSDEPGLLRQAGESLLNLLGGNDDGLRMAADNSLVEGHTVRRRLIIPPGMCGHNSLFVGQIGDWTWDAVFRLCDVNTYNARNEEGNPAYLTFFYYDIIGNPRTHLKLFTVGDEIEVLTSLYQTDPYSIHAVHQICLAPADPRKTPAFKRNRDEIFTDPDERFLYVENFNRWISRVGGKGNENLAKSTPKNFHYKHLPTLDTTKYPPRNHYRDALQNNSFTSMISDDYQPLSESVFAEDYTIDMVRDINGVGLLYFASYFTIIDEAILHLWWNLGGSDKAFLNRRIPDQKICFSGNADYNTALEIKTKIWQNKNEPTDYIFNVQVFRKKEQKLIGICTVNLLMDDDLSVSETESAH